MKKDRDYQIRNPKDIKELNNVFSMLEECFPKINRAFFIKRILGDPNYKKNQTYLLIKNKSFVSHVQLFKRRIYCYGRQLPIIGLGAICTLPAYRNKGYCRRLLEKIIQDIRKDAQALFIILFTRLPHFYEKLKFSKVIRKYYLLKRKKTKVKGPLNWQGLKIRRFNFDKDILPIMEIYENFFKSYFGPSVREFKDWLLQLSCFNEDKKLFLVLEDKREIKAYIRCKRFKEANQKIIDIIELATKDRDCNFLIYHLLNYLFKSTNADYLRIDSKLIKEGISEFFEIKERENSLLMYRFIKRGNAIYRLRMGEMIFLESDAF